MLEKIEIFMENQKRKSDFLEKSQMFKSAEIHYYA